jgi:Zn-dependent protease with chaperone function
MEDVVREHVQDKARFLAVNCQTNSNNHGYNIINRRYRRANIFTLDQAELQLAVGARDLDYGQELTKLARQLGSSYAWLTRGSHETLGRNCVRDISSCPPFERQVVDTVGAGDAFFAGFGKTKRIALFDTLIDKHNEEELLAVLAHEIGHGKLRHVPVQIAIGLAESALMFWLLHLALKSPAFFAAFGVQGQPIGLGLLFFSLLYQPLGMLLGLVSSTMSRKHEFEADAFAAQACTAAPLMTALKKLSTENLAHPQPHPLTVALHYSHPPLGERLAALEKV